MMAKRLEAYAKQDQAAERSGGSWERYDLNPIRVLWVTNPWIQHHPALRPEDVAAES